MSATTTRQLTTNGGSDGSTSTRKQTGTTKSERTSRAQTSEQTQTNPDEITTETVNPNVKETVETAAPQTETMQEDQAFTLSFTIPLVGTLPCEPLAI